MAKPSRPKESLRRLFTTLREAGYRHVEGEIRPDGTIHFRGGDSAPASDGDDAWRENQPLYKRMA